MLAHTTYLHVFILSLTKKSEAGTLTSPEKRTLVQRFVLTTRIKRLPPSSGPSDPFHSLQVKLTLNSRERVIGNKKVNQKRKYLSSLTEDLLF